MSPHSSPSLNPDTFRFQVYSSVNEIGKETWEQCTSASDAQLSKEDPFTCFEFFSALENAHQENRPETAACSSENGWEAAHIILRDENVSEGLDRTLAIMPAYLKHHSYGEYIFDWGWTDAYHRNGFNYYPKLVAAVPFTPSPGPRILFNTTLLNSDRHEDRNLIGQALTAFIDQLCEEQRWSSAHSLYPNTTSKLVLTGSKWLERYSFQYHWYNRNLQNQAFGSFNDFLNCFKSRKRKAVNKERSSLAKYGLKIRQRKGHELNSDDWDLFYSFYRRTYLKRSGSTGYLPREFFHRIGETMAHQILLVTAERQDKGHENECIAAALNFYSDTTLFGRYWGCNAEAEFLHFELCYYQGIEFCITNGLGKFEAGAQGEHKLQRGFIPTLTYSYHSIQHPQFREAIAQFLQQESRQVLTYMKDAKQYLPFNEDYQKAFLNE